MLTLAVFLLCMVVVEGDVTATISQHWQGGFQGKVCVPVEEEMQSWKIRLVSQEPITTLEAFTADVSESSADHKEFVLSSKAWNGLEHVGDEVCVEFQGHGNGDIQPHITAFFEGSSGEHVTAASQGPQGQPSTGQPATGPQGQASTVVPVTVQTAADGRITAPLTMMNDWDGRFQASFNFPLEEDANGWMANITFSSPVKSMDINGGQVLSHTPDNLHYVIVNQQDRPFAPKGTLSVSFYGDRENPNDGKLTGQAVFVNLGVDKTGHKDPMPKKSCSTYNYDDVLYKSILFYEAQRSGKLPRNNRIPWRGDSALDDRGDKGEDLTGGWYDAGDHIKFNFPMAYSTVVLLWGLLEFKDAYEASGQLEWMYESVKWPLDYLLKCHVADDELYVQVGNGGPDHSYWGRPEDMTMDRPGYKITADKPGSDIAMETAAAFAAGYMAFKEKDPAYADLLLQHAKTLWQFAVDHQGIYSLSVSEAAGFYRSMNYTDEMCWGSMWLYNATHDEKYLTEARKWFDLAPDWGFSWDDKFVGCQLMMYVLAGDEKGKQAVIDTFNTWFPGGTVPYTPDGLAWRLQWASLRYAINMAMVALKAAEYGILPDEYRHWAMCQVHYALGDTGFSYVIGYGDQGWPLRPHHRGSSCPNAPAPCGSAMSSTSAPSPHILYGAMVGGPNEDGSYEDSRTNYVNNEVACDYNAGMQTAVAGLYHLCLTGEHPQQIGHDVCPYTSS